MPSKDAQNDELERERLTLKTADLDIDQGEDRVSRQAAILASIRDRGHDTADAERLLGLLRETLAEWQKHRELIRARIAYLETFRSSGREG